jgi:hypothetical protein
MTFMSVDVADVYDDLARWPDRAQGRRMTFTSRLRAAWDCKECRTYRRLSLALGVLAVAAWLLQAS